MTRSSRPSKPAGRPRSQTLRASLMPLIVDVAVPLALYYLLRDAFGLSVVLSLALSGVLPAVRAGYGLIAERRVNALALLIVAVDVAGVVVSLLTGNPRLMLAKDSVVSSVVALAILISVVAGHPLMTAGMRPFMLKGSADREAAWDRLAAGSAAASRRFRRLELAFSTIWGLALLADCIARVIGAFTLPVATLVWLSNVMIFGAIGLAVVAGAPVTAAVDRLIRAEAGGGLATASQNNAEPA